MNIVIIGPAHPFRGGIADTNEAMCRAFKRAGHQCSLVTFTVQYPDLLFPGKSQFSEDPPPFGLDIKRWVHSFNPLNWLLAARKINALNPDVVIVRYWLPFMAPCFGSVLRLLRKNILVIGLTDNVIPHESRFMDKAFTSYFMQSCDGFMALSKAVLNDLKSLSPKPSTYFPHPINDQLPVGIEKQEARKMLGLRTDVDYLLFFGFIRKYKGLDLLLRALADDRLKQREVHLLVAGESYESLDEYETIIRQYGMEERVVMKTEFIPMDEVGIYFSAADLVTQTYRSATQSGITQMALHYDKPALITRVGGLDEFIIEGKTGLFATTDPQDIADQIVVFLEGDRASYERHITEAKQNFSWDAFADHFVHFQQHSFAT
jgi:D-inositol-3-phosphate glycosyltransferase